MTSRLPRRWLLLSSIYDGIYCTLGILLISSTPAAQFLYLHKWKLHIIQVKKEVWGKLSVCKLITLFRSARAYILEHIRSPVHPVSKILITSKALCISPGLCQAPHMEYCRKEEDVFYYTPYSDDKYKDKDRKKMNRFKFPIIMFIG